MDCRYLYPAGLAIGMIKGLGAGAFSLAIALLLGRAMPPPEIIAAALCPDAIGYGLSNAMFILASRGMGTTMTKNTRTSPISSQ